MFPLPKSHQLLGPPTSGLGVAPLGIMPPDPDIGLHSRARNGPALAMTWAWA